MHSHTARVRPSKGNVAYELEVEFHVVRDLEEIFSPRSDSWRKDCVALHRGESTSFILVFKRLVSHEMRTDFSKAHGR